jgi:CelD/BcsL family acetyltransferase involved in cellulose biosynthesis
LKFTLHREFPAVIQNDWNALLGASINHVPFLRYEYLETWWQTRGGGEWPEAELAIITAENEDGLAGVAPLFLAEREGKKCLLFLGSIEISDYLDFIVREGDLQEFLNGLLEVLLNSFSLEWDALDLYNILEGSPSLPAFTQAATGKGLKAVITRLQHSPYIPLPSDWETYLSGIDKKQRHEIRRKLRRAEEAGSVVRWYFVEDGASLEAEMEAFMKLMANDEDKAKFLTPAMRTHMQRTAHCAFEAGCLQLAFLEVNGEKAAGYLNFDYLDKMWIYNSGLDWKFAEYSPGWVLLANLIRTAIETGHSEFDFMRGNEDYKYRFGAVDRFVMRVKIQRG